MALSAAMGPPLTALQSFGAGMGVIAHNLANVLTDGFKASRSNYQDLPSMSGVTISTQKLDQPSGPLVPAWGLPPSPGQVIPGFLEGSNTDVATEMVGLIVTSRAYQANAKVVPTVDEMLGTVINLKA